MATEFGFPFAGTCGDMEAMLRGPACRKAMEKGDFAIVGTCQKELHDYEDQDVLHERITKDIKEFNPDILVVNGLGLMNATMAYSEGAPGVPRISIDLQPQGMPSNQWKSAAFQRELPDKDTPPVATFLWMLIRQEQVEHWTQIVKEKSKEDAFRAMDYYGTPEKSFEDCFEPDKWLVPRFMAYSPSFWPNPDDWPKSDNIKVVGNLKLSKKTQDEYTQKGSKYFSVGSDYELCKEFIAKVGPPVYVGWGSMMVYTKEHMTLLAVEALKRAGEKAIILGGWAGIAPDGLDGAANEAELKEWCKENVLFIKAAPHELLFPQCKAAIHHGGIGTLQASIAAGCPTVITPVFADQFDNAKHLEKIECGVQTKRLGKLKAKELGEAIKTICSNPKYKENTKRVSEAMLKEDGVGTTVAWLEKFFKEEVQTGKFKEKLNEQKERLYLLRQKNIKHDVNQLNSKFTSAVTPRFPALKEWNMKNMKFMAIASDLAGQGKLWVVEGSSVLAKEGASIKTAEAGRFKRFAFVEEVENDGKGTRMHVKRLKGRGPEEGWVTTQVKGKDMLRKVSHPMEIGGIMAQEMAELFSDVFAPAEEEGKEEG
eukprot:CAMPEP_0204539512 /NCGR_PEP_ID=MMETSP0661-20131031/16776_1 /ASSEMBLY_ACC=CAM_ASM_000606 /TAXON_ID=109239 /ORGANISM="Alexandrium margalefi, Strain AMGDE01CS-322" /LENGTH=595 /DNA_ID=CAMNT_0051546125 /DNA_START=116 /DNA_END=1903 /DNA_ORIENTATION=+